MTQCAPVTQKDKDAVISYVGKRFHVSQDLITIAQTELANESCFWIVHLRASKPARTLTLYLSPDHSFLSSDLYDLNIDPLVGLQKEHLATMKLLAASSSPDRGAPEATITIVEFSDFQCPYCKQMADTITAVLGDTSSASDIKIVYKNFPLPMHDWAHQAAAMAECAHKLAPDKFWPLHDYLFSNQASLSSSNVKDRITGFLTQAGTLSPAALDACFTDPDTTAFIERDVQLGEKLGVSSTPTLFINGEKFEGAQGVAQVNKILQRVRADSSNTSK